MLYYESLKQQKTCNQRFKETAVRRDGSIKQLPRDGFKSGKHGLAVDDRGSLELPRTWIRCEIPYADGKLAMHSLR